MASQVSIMNRALTHLGESTILLPTDNVKQARVLSAIYDDTRDAELRAFVAFKMFLHTTEHGLDTPGAEAAAAAMIAPWGGG